MSHSASSESLCISEGGFLYAKHFSDDDPPFAIATDLLVLTPEEANSLLTVGRFAHFVPNPFQYRVRLAFEELDGRVEEHINFITEHQHRWSLDVSRLVGFSYPICATYSFDDFAMAVLMQLRFEDQRLYENL